MHFICKDAVILSENWGMMNNGVKLELTTKWSYVTFSLKNSMKQVKNNFGINFNHKFIKFSLLIL